MKILYLFGIILIKYYTSKHFDTKIIISNRKILYMVFYTKYYIWYFIIDLRYILCYYDIVFKFCVIPL